MEAAFKPIYVCGSMRSGTTILQKVICLSPDVNPFGAAARYLMEQMQLYVRFAGTDAVYIDDYFGGVNGFRSFTRDLVHRIQTEAWSNSGRPSAIVLKSPELSVIIPETFKLLGAEARFVFSVREPKDTIASMIRAGERQRAAKIPTMLARLGRNIDGLCTVYNRAYEPILRDLDSSASRLRRRVLFTKYEDLVATPEKVQSRICAFCEITSAPIPVDGKWRVSKNSAQNKKRFADNPRWSAYITELSDQPISEAGVGKHKSVLSAAECNVIDSGCRKVREFFEYG